MPPCHSERSRRISRRFDEKIQIWLDAPTVGAGFKPALIPIVRGFRSTWVASCSASSEPSRKTLPRAEPREHEYWLFRGATSLSSFPTSKERQRGGQTGMSAPPSHPLPKSGAKPAASASRGWMLLPASKPGAKPHQEREVIDFVVKPSPILSLRTHNE